MENTREKVDKRLDWAKIAKLDQVLALCWIIHFKLIYYLNISYNNIVLLH